MRNYILLFLLFIGFEGISQNNETYQDYIDRLESDIVFNEYIKDEVKIKKLNQFLLEIKSEDFKQKEILLKYAQVNLSFIKDDDEQALYKFVEITETCDITQANELRIYLGSLLQISNILRNNNAVELSYRYIEKGINIIERENLDDYPWIQDFYNDAGVDLISMGKYDKCLTVLKKAISFGKNKDYLKDAMIEYNLSFLYFEINNIDSAIYHQKNTVSYLEKINNLTSFPELYNRYGNSLGSLAIFYYSNNNIPLAKETAEKAKRVFEKIETFDSGRYPHLFTLINIAITNNEKENINTLLQEIEFVAGKVEAGKFNFYQLLSDSYQQIGNTQQENHYLRLAYSQFQSENTTTIIKLQQYNSKLQAQILQLEKIRFQNEKIELNRKALLNTIIISLIFVFVIAVLYMLYIKVRNKKNLLEKEKEISKIEIEKNEIKSKLTEIELNEKRQVTKRLASHIKLKQQTEATFLKKIKELKRSKPQNFEAEISELQVKMINLINIDQNFEQQLQVNDLNQEFRAKLKKTHPDLSEKELQFCTYLILDLTAKEIGSITNQSDGAIRVYKNRLKNKIIGNKDLDLVKYLQNI